MRTFFRSLILGLVLTCFAASCASNESIESGQKFGVHVGMPLDDAGAILRRRGLQPGSQRTDELTTMCGARPRGQGEQVRSFTDARGGFAVCLFAVSGRVVAIAWEHAGL
jgi:hypothetical protein